MHIPKDKDTKIDVNQLKDKMDRNSVHKSNQLKYICESMKILQPIFSKKLPSERYNGIMNLHYITLNRNATTEEIESALVIKQVHSKFEMHLMEF